MSLTVLPCTAAHRTATQHALTSRDVIRIYNALHPHPALSPIPVDTPSREVQRGNERAYRLLLVQDLLRTLLPPADLENDCLRTLMEEILAEAVLGKLVLGKATESCIWWELCAKLCETLHQRRPSRKQTPATVSTEDAAPNTIKSPVRLVDVWSRLQSIMSSCFFALGYFLLLLFYAGRGILIAFVTSPSLPSRRPLGPPSPSLSLKNSPPSQDDPSSPSYDQQPTAPQRSKPLSPLITSEILTTVSLLLDLPRRMPWLQSSIQLLQWGFLVGPGRIGAADGILDR